MGIVLCFIPLALLTGPFIPDLFILITVLLFIYKRKTVDLLKSFNKDNKINLIKLI